MFKSRKRSFICLISIVLIFMFVNISVYAYWTDPTNWKWVYLNGRWVDYEVQKGVAGTIESHAGAHYYTQSPHTTRYNSAMGVADIKNTWIDYGVYSNRVAYISLGTLSQMTETTGEAVDFGIRNDGNGWHVYYYTHGNYDVDFYTGRDEDHPDLPPAQYFPHDELDHVYMNVSARIEVDYDDYGNPEYKDVLDGYFVFVKKDGEQVPVSVTIRRPKGTLFASSWNNKPLLRFVRFMSLVPKDGLDRLDWSFLQATMKSLQLYDSVDHCYKVWDFNSDLVQNCWTVQNNNIKNFYSNWTIDHINIKHEVNYW